MAVAVLNEYARTITCPPGCEMVQRFAVRPGKIWKVRILRLINIGKGSYFILTSVMADRREQLSLSSMEGIPAEALSMPNGLALDLDQARKEYEFRLKNLGEMPGEVDIAFQGSEVDID
jgi:hypothetical protein